jgi:hypothetical protein
MVVPAYALENCKSPQGIILKENVGFSDASVYMCFCGYVYYGVNLMNQAVHELGVSYVTFDEGVALVVFYFMQVCWVSSDSYFINVDNFTIRIFAKQVSTEVAADES